MESGDLQLSEKQLQSKGFVGCLEIANKHETSVIALLRNKGFHNLFRPEGYFKDYDFSMVFNFRRYFFECKKDLKAAKTGNIAIEIGFRNNPSGIAVTKADFYVINIAEKDYIISVAVLKLLVKEGKYFKEVMGGDNYASRLLLFKASVLTTKATLL